MNIDIISDIHFDLWLNNKNGKNLKSFVSKMIPNVRSNTLLIAGDLGHSNTQNANGLKYLREYYKNIVIVPGNHDFWLLHDDQKTKFNFNSFKRIDDFKSKIADLENVYFLDGNFVEVDGLTIGGCCGYCDDKFAIKHLGYEEEMVRVLFNRFADSRYIFNGPGNDFNWLGYHAGEMEKLNSLVNFCDVIMTHHIPIWEHVREEYRKTPFTTFFHFDGYELVKDFKGTWIYGHTHDEYDYVHGNARFICNPLGYEHERFFGPWEKFNKFPVRIKTYNIPKV